MLIDILVWLWVILTIFGSVSIAWGLYHAIQDQRWLVRSDINNEPRQIVAWALVRGESIRLLAMLLLGVVGITIQITEFPRSTELLIVIFSGLALIAALLLVESVLSHYDRNRLAK